MLGDEPTTQLEGRAAELAALAAALDDARAGHGRMVLVTGEAGIGKSALLTSLASRATAQGFRPIWGRAWEFADAPPYFPVRACLSALGVQAEAQAQSPFALWESVLEALSRASQSEPSLWLLEDLHAADLQTLDLLTFLAQPLRVLPALVVVTARPHDPRLGERGEQRLLRMARDALDLRLAPLSPDGTTRLAESLAGELPAAVRRELLELTSGNPLFVVECARAIKARGFHSLRGVSPTIRHVVLERLQLLPEPTRELLESASVLGRDFSAALLSRMHDVLPARVVDALLPALRGGVLLERGPGSFSFSHVLVQGAIYDGLSAEQRCRLHGRAQLALESLPGTPEISLERARHALGALTPESESSALQLALRAGRSLEASGAYDRAHALYARLREKVTTGELSRELEPRELLHMASVAERAGKGSEGRSLSLLVLRRARDAGDHELFALAALELGGAIRPGLIDAELVAALREALAQLNDDSSALGCRLLARLAAALQPATDPRVPVDMALDAIARARRVGDEALLLQVLDVAGSACVEYGPLDERLSQAEELLELARAARDFTRLQRARSRLAFERATQGNFDAFDLHVADNLRDADAAGQAQARVRPLLMASLSAANRGKAGESSRLIAEAQQLLALTDDPSLSLSLRAHSLSRAIMLHSDPELEQLEPQFSKLVAGVPEAGLTLSVLRGALRARLERREAAREDLLTAWPLVGNNLGVFLSLVAETAAFVGEREISSRCRGLVAALPGTDLLGGHVSVSYEGPIERLLALLDAALGDLGSAERKLRASLALLEQRGFSTWVAQVRYDLGNVLAAAGRSAEARELWLAAAQLAEQCEMVGLVKRAGARAADAGAAPVSVHAEAKAHGPLLMEREGELFRLERGAISVRIRATRGAELLARLIEAPGREIHVLALASDETTVTTESNAGDSIDRAALRQYRARLKDLSELVVEAEARADLGRLEQLRREQNALEAEVKRALGLGGRTRQAGSTTERARVNAQRRLKDAIERVAETSPELSAWLARCVRTGTYCAFYPTP
jgi:tetratricopeptide (TPR) repeat protein